MDIWYRITAEQDDQPVRGNIIDSGDEKFDKEVEDSAIQRLDDGDVWAWAVVTVTASVVVNGERFEGRAYLGGCSYKDVEDFKEQNDYAIQMEQEAREDLLDALRRSVARGEIAKTILAELKDTGV